VSPRVRPRPGSPPPGRARAPRAAAGPTALAAGAPAAILALLLLAGGPAAAEPVVSLFDGRSGRVAFRSVTPAGPSQLLGGADRAPAVVVSGELRLPAGADGPAPALVIAHGSGGILPGREHAWARRLGARGVASFVVDSFTPRGLAATGTDQTRLSTMANLADALHALRLLATHPRIDPARIGVMGFSRGGQVALYSALEPLRRSVVGDGLRFAAHVAFYPSCSIPYRAARVTGAPILLLLGGADDYTPPAACRAYAEWFRARGTPVRVVEYPGAHHDFDLPGPPRFLPRLQSARSCRAEVDVDRGVLRRLDTGETLRGPAVGDYVRACAERGATIGGDPEALTRAERDLEAFLVEVLGR
jgi:dienelactone hydrolase